MGQKVSTIASAEKQGAGEYSYHFQCPVAGVYIVKMQEDRQVFIKKLSR